MPNPIIPLLGKAYSVAAIDDRILIRVREAPQMVGRIHLPDVAKVKPQLGEVLACGPGKRLSDGTLDAMGPVAVGKDVLFVKFGGNVVPTDTDGEYLFLRRADVLAVVEEQA